MRSVNTATVRVLVVERLMHCLTRLGAVVWKIGSASTAVGHCSRSRVHYAKSAAGEVRKQRGRSGDAVDTSANGHAHCGRSGDVAGTQPVFRPVDRRLRSRCARSTLGTVRPAVETCDYVLTTGSCGRQLRQVSCGRSGGVVETQSALLDFQPTAGVAALTQLYLQLHNADYIPTTSTAAAVVGDCAKSSAVAVALNSSTTTTAAQR